MVISHIYKYVFVELPFTGTTSIAGVLLEHCEGARTLHRHATYNEFLKIATPQEKEYFVFSCIRNPLDVAVTDYCKHKAGFYKKFSNPGKSSSRRKRLVNSHKLRKMKFITDPEVSFSTYFLRYYKLPYDDWSAISHTHCNVVLRYEHLQQDFSRALKKIGIEDDVRLPVANKTAGKRDDFVSFYDARAVERAKHVFGPYMKKWCYDFPSQWGETSLSWQVQKEHQAANVVRRFCWTYLKPIAARWALFENR